MSLALATNLGWTNWMPPDLAAQFAANEQTLLTAFELLDEQAEEMRNRGR